MERARREAASRSSKPATKTGQTGKAARKKAGQTAAKSAGRAAAKAAETGIETAGRAAASSALGGGAAAAGGGAAAGAGGVAAGGAAAAGGTAAAGGAAATAPAWIVPVAIGCAIIIGILILFVFIVLLTAALRGRPRGDTGRTQTEPPAYVKEQSKITNLLTIAGDLPARKDAVEEKQKLYTEAFTNLRTTINSQMPDGENKTKALNLLNEIETLSNELFARINNLLADPANLDTKGNIKKFPEKIFALQKVIKTKIQELGVIIDSGAGSKGEIIVAIARAEMARDVSERCGNNVPCYPNGTRTPYNTNSSWCASFVGWVYRHQEAYPNYKGDNWVPNIWEYMKKNHIAFLAGDSKYTPQPGDLFMTSEDGHNDGLSHIGIVAEVLEGGKSIRTIEGNSGNRLRSNPRQVGQFESGAWRFARMSY